MPEEIDHQLNAIVGLLSRSGHDGLCDFGTIDHEAMSFIGFELKNANLKNEGDLAQPTLCITLSNRTWPQRRSSICVPIYQRIVHFLELGAPILMPILQSFGPGREYRFNISDEGSADLISMDREIGAATLLMPDISALELAKSSMATSDRAAFSRDYRSRKPVLMWRGSTTGVRLSSLDRVSDNLRIRAALFCRAFASAETDVRLVEVVQTTEEFRRELLIFLHEKAILSHKVDEAEFAQSAFWLDLEGNTAAWGIINKMMMGMLVFRPDGDRETDFISGLEADRDFIPVRRDLSDLPDKLRWARSEPASAEQVAWQGYDKASTYVRNMRDRLSSVMSQQLKNPSGGILNGEH